MFRYGIGVTDNPQVVESTLRAFNNNCFVITLEEQGSIFNLTLPNFTKGTILLPPPSAEIAAIDGDEHGFTEFFSEQSYDVAYIKHFCTKTITEYITKIKRGSATKCRSYKEYLDNFFDINKPTPEKIEIIKREVGIDMSYLNKNTNS